MFECFLASVLVSFLLQPPPAGAAALVPPAAELRDGRAAWYGERFQGKPTANGESFDMRAFTAAHRTLPFGTNVRVHHPCNGRSVVVRINDRGPYSEKRTIDLSRAAAEALDLAREGSCQIRYEVLAP